MKKKNRILIICLFLMILIISSASLAANATFAAGNTADYTEVDAALARVPSDLSSYTDVSRIRLEKAMEAVVRDLVKDQQSAVDRFAADINEAVDRLLQRQNAPAVLFDEDNIVLSFGVLSDTHIGSLGMDSRHGWSSSYKTRKMLEMMLEIAQTNGKALDAVAFAGDMTEETHNTSSNSQIEDFKELIESCLDISSVQVMYSLGNHDGMQSGQDFITMFNNTMTGKTAVEDYKSTDYFKHAENDSVIDWNRVHFKINGYHFLCVPFSTDGKYGLDPDTKTWLKGILDDIVAEDPGAYIFLISHMLPKNTAWHTQATNSVSNKDLYDILKDYPQAMIFGGHTHSVLNMEQTIDQNHFTSVNTGSVNYCCPVIYYTENGNYSYGEGVMDTYMYAQSILVEVDNNGNTRITRLDAFNNAVLGYWILPAPDEDRYFLERYTKYRKYLSPEPVFEEDAWIKVDQKSPGSIAIEFDAASDSDGYVTWYKIEIFNKGTELNSLNLNNNIFLYPSPDLMPDTISTIFSEIDIVPGEKYTVKITAYDEYNNASESIEYEHIGEEKWAHGYYLDLRGEDTQTFNHNDTTVIATNDYLEVEFHNSIGTGGTLKSRDAYFVINLPTSPVTVREFPIIALRVKTNLSTKLIFYPYTTGDPRYWAHSEKAVVNTTEWQTVYVDFTKAMNFTTSALDGNYLFLRLDFENSAGSLIFYENTYFYIESVALFQDGKSAAMYAGYDSTEENPTLNSPAGVRIFDAYSDISVNNTNQCMVDIGSALNVSFMGNQDKSSDNVYFAINLGETSVSASENPYIVMCAKSNIDDLKAAIRFRTDQGVSYSAVNLLNMDRNGVWRTYLIDFTNAASGGTNWNNGNYLSVKIDLFNSEDGTLSYEEGSYFILKCFAFFGDKYSAVMWEPDWLDLSLQNVSYTGSTVVGASLDASKLDCDNDIEGTFSFAQDYNVLSGSRVYEWIFTPTDTSYPQMRGSLVITAQQRTQTVLTNIRYSGSLKVGDQLDPSKLTGESNVEGTFAFLDAKVKDGNNAYKVVFTPNDSNYLPVESAIILESEQEEFKEGCGSRIASGSLFTISALLGLLWAARKGSLSNVGV